MKEKWTKLFAFLNITKVESSADGIFMAEADVDKMNAVHADNETLRASLKTEQDAHTATVTSKDAVIAGLNGEKATLTTANTTLTAENTRLTTELAAAQAGETIVPAKAADPSPDGKKKALTANEAVLADLLANTSATEKAMYAPKAKE